MHYAFRQTAVLFLSISGALLALGVVSEPRRSARAQDATSPEVRAMAMDDLLREFHGYREMITPVGQRRTDVINGLRRLGPPLHGRLRADMSSPEAEVRRRA